MISVWTFNILYLLFFKLSLASSIVLLTSMSIFMRVILNLLLGTLFNFISLVSILVYILFLLFEIYFAYCLFYLTLYFGVCSLDKACFCWPGGMIFVVCHPKLWPLFSLRLYLMDASVLQDWRDNCWFWGNISEVGALHLVDQCLPSPGKADRWDFSSTHSVMRVGKQGEKDVGASFAQHGARCALPLSVGWRQKVNIILRWMNAYWWISMSQHWWHIIISIWENVMILMYS